MFLILLRFSDNENQAARHLAGHKQWLRRGFQDGVFLLAGSLNPGVGGGILAQGASRDVIEQRVKEDPFVASEIVEAEILDFDPGMAADRLQFLIS